MTMSNKQSSLTKLVMLSKEYNTTWWVNTAALVIGFSTYLLSASFGEKKQPPTDLDCCGNPVDPSVLGCMISGRVLDQRNLRNRNHPLWMV